MSSETAQVIFNTRERLTSTDLNRQIDLHHRQVQEQMGAIVSPDRTVSGVISGLTAVADAALKTVTVSPGLALLYEPVPGSPDSPWRWIEVTSPITASLPTGAGHDRWVAIDIAPGTVVTRSGIIVDVWDPTIPPAGDFVPQSRDKERKSLPVISFTEGTDNSPNPANFPLGTTGKVPLSLIFMDAADVISDGTFGMVQCRPILRPPGAHDPDVEAVAASRGPSIAVSLASVTGGGVGVTSNNSETITIRTIQGRFARSQVGFQVSGESFDILEDNFWNNGSTGRIPDASTGVVYVYAAPPPYPSGYDAMATRELFIGAAVTSKFVTSKSTMHNCILVLSTAPPAGNGFQGAPFTTGLIADWPFRDGTAKKAVENFEWIYVGAFDYGPDGLGDMSAKEQTYEGGGIVSLTQRGPYTNLDSLGDGSYDLRIRNNGADDSGTGNLPTSAKVLNTIFRASFNNVPVGEFLEVFVEDDQPSAELNYVLTCPSNSAGFEMSHPMRLVQHDFATTFTINTEPTNMFTFGPHVVGYVDSFLAKR